MKPIRVVAVFGLVSVAALAAGCKGGPSPAPVETKDDDLRIYLGKDGKMYKWEQDITAAVCELEKHTSGIPDEDKYCPVENPTGTPPPSYPPAR
jgi:hypothetical protein